MERVFELLFPIWRNGVKIDLVEDILIEILTRLPVKDLMRFKCVCKSWYFLIKFNPNFIAKHLANTSSNEDRANMILVRDSWSSVALLSDKTLNQFAKVRLPFTGSYVNCLEIYGSCNGIVCVHTDLDPDHELALWNPSTREYRYLPKNDVSSGGARSSMGIFGFGFDPKTNDYKVVNIYSQYHKPQVEVYNLSTDSWRKINATLPIKSPIHPWRAGLTSSTYLEGFIYWYTRDHGNKDRGLVVSFDVHNEVFGKKLLPGGIYSFTSDLVNFNESIALIERRNIPEGIFKVWVMKVDGLKKTWTKLLTIGYNRNLYRLLGFSRSGNAIIKKTDGGLLSFNLRTKLCNQLEICWDHWLDPVKIGQVVNYVESLVSVKAGNWLSEEVGGSTSTNMVPGPIYGVRTESHRDSNICTIM